MQISQPMRFSVEKTDSPPEVTSRSSGQLDTHSYEHVPEPHPRNGQRKQGATRLQFNVVAGVNLVL